VLPPSDSPAPVYVQMRAAVAATPSGSTRWSQVSVPPQKRAMWLVPARPGAAVDWSEGRFLDALDDATAPRVLPPNAVFPCPVPFDAERAASWAIMASGKLPSAPVVVKTTAADATAWATERGYVFGADVGARIAALYESGWVLLAIELGSSTSNATSATLRVSDDGGAVVPLAITTGANVNLTVFAIGAGVASVPGSTDIEPAALMWGASGSTYETWRRGIVEGGGWLRESSAHEALFEQTPVPTSTAIRSVASAYFEDSTCAATAWSMRSNTGVVGSTCAPGAAARVPGGTTCVASPGAVDPALFACGNKIDLALALSAIAPQDAVVTRWSTSIPGGSSKSNVALTIDAATARKSPVVRAGSFGVCPPAPPQQSSGSVAPPMRQPSSSSGGAVTVDHPAPVVISDGCGGSIVAAGSSDDDIVEEPPPDDSSSESCSSDGSSGWDDSDSDSSDGWDDSDGSDSCSSDDSSSSSDSCGSSSSDSSGSDDGWDTEDSEMSPQSKGIKAGKKPQKKPHVKRTKNTRSPVSRFALLGAALLLPLRRRRRDPEQEF
jgi:hypothetical protein